MSRCCATVLYEIDLSKGLLPFEAIAQTASPLQILAFWSASKKFQGNRSNIVRDRPPRVTSENIPSSVPSLEWRRDFRNLRSQICPAHK